MEDDHNNLVNEWGPQLFINWKTNSVSLASPCLTWAWHSSAPACIPFLFVRNLSQIMFIGLVFFSWLVRVNNSYTLALSCFNLLWFGLLLHFWLCLQYFFSNFYKSTYHTIHSFNLLRMMLRNFSPLDLNGVMVEQRCVDVGTRTPVGVSRYSIYH
jgi:hypothetical protein